MNLFILGVQAGIVLMIALGTLVFGIGGCLMQAWKEINEIK